VKGDREIVLEKWPDAWAQRSVVFKDWAIYQFPFPANACAGQGGTQEEAWKDAATRIRKEGNQPSQEPSASSAASASLAE
jgi:hypothetical protein